MTVPIHSRPSSLLPDALDDAEAALLDLHRRDGDAAAVFILGAPRTGSTLLYQGMAATFGLPYVSNLTNACFPTRPILGIAIQNGVRVDIAFESAYGKTEGPFQPSEGSAVMAGWFGGGHPSQIVSTGILKGREIHFKRTLAAAEAVCGSPLLVKNAWHCFRVAYLARTLPRARFVWIRRDIREAAHSDLQARLATKGDANAWNSATPANVEELSRLPPGAQVVENQLAFNKAIEAALPRDAPSRSLQVWYEDLIADPRAVLANVGLLIDLPPRSGAASPRLCGQPRGGRRPREIWDYVAGDPGRFNDQMYPARESCR